MLTPSTRLGRTRGAWDGDDRKRPCRVSRLTASVAAALAALLLGCPACTDFGFELDPPPQRDAGADGSVPLDGCVEGPTTPSADGPVVRFDTLDVDRRLLVIRAGEQVTWINASSQPHTATSGAPGAVLGPERGGFESGTLAPGGAQWAFRFCTPRTIEWFCRTHPAQMFGYRLVVE